MAQESGYAPEQRACANFVRSTMWKVSPRSLQQTKLSVAEEVTISNSFMRKGATLSSSSVTDRALASILSAQRQPDDDTERSARRPSPSCFFGRGLRWKPRRKPMAFTEVRSHSSKIHTGLCHVREQIRRNLNEISDSRIETGARTKNTPPTARRYHSA